MSVLIKGAKMPSTCRDCFVMCDNYDKETWRYERHKNCPLIEIPTPHGRLIDADYYLTREKPKGIGEETWQESHLYKSVTNADTIIEADKDVEE